MLHRRAVDALKRIIAVLCCALAWQGSLSASELSDGERLRLARFAYASTEPVLALSWLSGRRDQAPSLEMFQISLNRQLARLAQPVPETSDQAERRRAIAALQRRVSALAPEATDPQREELASLQTTLADIAAA